MLRRLALLLPCLLAGAGPARAAGLALPSVGHGQAGPAVTDATAVYWSPGQIGFVRAGELLVGGQLVAGDLRYRRERRAAYQREDSFDFALPIRAEAVDPDKRAWEPEVSVRPLGAAPDLFVAWPLGDTALVAAFGLYAPFGALLDLPADGPQRWVMQTVNLATVYATPSLAWRLGEAVSVGGGVSWVVGYAELAKVVDFAELADMGQVLGRPPIDQANDFGPEAPPAVRELGVMSRRFVVTDAWAHGLTFDLGVALRPADGLRLSAAYRHGVELAFDGDFTADMDDDFFTRDLASQGLQYPALLEGRATVRLPLPRRVLVGVAGEPLDWLGLDLELSWTSWSDVQSLDVDVESPGLAQPAVGLPDTTSFSLPRRWQDTIEVEGRARLAAGEGLGLWVSAGYHSPASPDETTDLASPDGHRVVGGAGVSWAVDPALTLVADVKVQVVLPRRIVASRHDVANGEYRLLLGAAGVHARVHFE